MDGVRSDYGADQNYSHQEGYGGEKKNENHGASFSLKRVRRGDASGNTGN